MAVKTVLPVGGLAKYLQALEAGLATKTGAETISNKVITGMQETVTDISGDGAITIVGGIVTMSKGSAAAVTIAAPSVAQEGTVIKIVSKSAYAHVVTFTGATLLPGVAAKTTATYAAFVGASLTVVAVNQKWCLLSNVAVTLS